MIDKKLEKLNNMNDLSKKYEFYKGLLTTTQKECFEMHYFYDMSLQEIAEVTHKTRQAVKASVDSAVKIINKLERVLDLYKKTKEIKNILAKILLKHTDLENDINKIIGLIGG